MAQKLVIFVLLVFFVTSQVSAIRCYMCISQRDEECKSNPKQEKFERDCGESRGTLFSSLGSNPNAFTDHETNEIEPRAFTFQCASASFTNITSGQTSLERGCVIKYINDASLKIISLVHGGIQVDKIRRCNTDLCNFQKL